MLITIFKGITVGFSLATPGDKIGFLCIKETSKNGINLGFIAGLGAASADFIYGILTAFILNLSNKIITNYESITLALSALFLCFMGIKRIIDTPHMDEVEPIKGYLNAYGKTFVKTLTNFSTIAEFFSLFIGFNVDISDYRKSISFVIAVFVGAVLWWFSVCILDALVHMRLAKKILRTINYMSACVLVGIGVYSVIKAFFV